MEIVISEFQHCHLVEIFGRIDSYTTPQIETALKSLMNDDHYNIIVDLQNVNFISSSGILTLVKIQRKFKRDNLGALVLLNVPELVFHSFEIAGFHTVFNFFEELGSAQSYFQRSA